MNITKKEKLEVMCISLFVLSSRTKYLGSKNVDTATVRPL